MFAYILAQIMFFAQLQAHLQINHIHTNIYFALIMMPHLYIFFSSLNILSYIISFFSLSLSIFCF